LWNRARTNRGIHGWMQSPAFYDYMTCMGVNPCWGWLNTNETWRNATQARADELNVEYGKLVAQRRGEFKNFKLLYFNPDLDTIIGQYMAAPVAAGSSLKRERCANHSIHSFIGLTD
jgi:hypothetical protein